MTTSGATCDDPLFLFGSTAGLDRMRTKASTTRPPLWKVWLVASRPHTLTASITPLIVSYNAGVAEIDNLDKVQYFHLALQCALFAILIQLGTNLHNDYADFVKGADTDKRVGQARATQKGWLTPTQTAMGATVVLVLALLVGLNFLFHMQGGIHRTMVMGFIVFSSIFNAFAYTGGPWPLGYIGLGNFSIGYSGLGDFFVFLYFGLVATLTLPFLYVSYTGEDRNVGSILWKLAPYAVQVAALATNIIVVNNLRDRHTDVEAKKQTLAVRFGAGFCQKEFLFMVVAAYGLVLVDFVGHDFCLPRLLPLLTLPLAQKEVRAIYTKDGGALNPHVGGSAKVQLFFCILLGVGLRLS